MLRTGFDILKAGSADHETPNWPVVRAVEGG